MAIAINIFSNVGGTIESALVQPAQKIAESLSGNMIPFVGAGITIWVMVYSLAVVRGAVHMPVPDFTWRVFKVSLILFFAIGGGIFQGNAFAFYSEISNAIYESIYQAGGGTCPISSNDPMGIYKALDCAAGEIFTPFVALWHGIEKTVAPPDVGWTTMLSTWLKVALSAILFFIMAIVALLLSLLFIAYAGFEIISLRVTIALAFAVSPLFFYALLFDPIKNFFSNWLHFVIRSIVFQALFIVFMGVALAAITNLGTDLLEVAESDDLGLLLLTAIINLFSFTIMVLIFIFTATRLPRLASDLIGGAPDGAGVGTVLTAMAGKALAKAGFSKLLKRNKSGGSISDSGG